MFSANENLVLRQAKKRVVAWVEECIPETALDAGVNVMVMQVSCKAPGCVPLETAIIIVFPSSASELLPGLKQSAGGSYKTKILLPLNDVTKSDVLEALPPSFRGGLRTMEKLCVSARDVMLAKIAQIFGDENEESSIESRTIMALYLQSSLQEYMNRGCVAPPWGEPFPTEPAADESAPALESQGDETVRLHTSTPPTLGSTTSTSNSGLTSLGGGNIVIRRPLDRDEETSGLSTARFQRRDDPIPQSASANVSSPPLGHLPASRDATRRTPSVNSRAALRRQQAASLELSRGAATGAASYSSSSLLLSRLAEREHAPGIRQAGCPCCEPDHPSNVVDQLMLL